MGDVGPMVTWLPQMAVLTRLELEAGPPSPDLAAALCRCTALRELSLCESLNSSYCWDMDAFYACLSGCAELTTLEGALMDTEADCAAFVAAVPQWVRLRRLELCVAHYSPLLLPAVAASCSKLRSFKVSSDFAFPASADDVHALAALCQLRQLSFQRVILDADAARALPALSSLTNLRELGLRTVSAFDSCYADLFSTLATLPELQQLDVSHAKSSGGRKLSIEGNAALLSFPLAAPQLRTFHCNSRVESAELLAEAMASSGVQHWLVQLQQDALVAFLRAWRRRRAAARLHSVRFLAYLPDSDDAVDALLSFARSCGRLHIQLLHLSEPRLTRLTQACEEESLLPCAVTSVVTSRVEGRYDFAQLHCAGLQLHCAGL
eukprot:PLAT12291.3.p1 GENE.PLAT12291.3~~PLAT12291.3.p1  ORF type:complete len:379 (+),score=136.45 PLAT12291.3:484-1620(+)